MSVRKARASRTTLKLPNEPIRVQVVKSEKREEPRRQFVVNALLAALILTISIWGIYVIPVAPVPIIHPGADNQQLELALTFPGNLAVGDAGAIDLTVTNLSDSPISGTVTLRFAPSPSPPIHLIDDSQVTLRLNGLAAGERQTNHIDFQIALSPWPLFAGQISFTPQLELDGQASVDHTPQQISVWPIPQFRSLFSGGMGTLLIVLFWDRIKKWLFPAG